jgi:hypothetical protein
MREDRRDEDGEHRAEPTCPLIVVATCNGLAMIHCSKHDRYWTLPTEAALLELECEGREVPVRCGKLADRRFHEVNTNTLDWRDAADTSWFVDAERYDGQIRDRRPTAKGS